MGQDNLAIDTIEGKRSTELWNWYTEGLDSNLTGLLSGEIKRVRHNIMPTATNWSWALQRGDLSVTFQPAPYPRTIRLDTLGSGFVGLAVARLRAITSDPAHPDQAAARVALRMLFLDHMNARGGE